MGIIKRYRVKYLFNYIKQLINRPDVSLLGAYDYNNVGDMALAQTINDKIKEQNPNLKIGTRTLHNFSIFPKSKSIIVGGGALINSERILKFIMNEVSPENISFIGCEIERKSKHFKED